jgi:hypothetical protein
MDLDKHNILLFRGRLKSGKTTAALYFANQYPNVVKLAFADALKVEVYDALHNRHDPFWGWAKAQGYSFEDLCLDQG